MTTLIGALDSRLKAVAPACYVNSYRLLFAGPNPDTEMTLPGFLSSGLDMADFLEVSAPTPWLILATECLQRSPRLVRSLRRRGETALLHRRRPSWNTARDPRRNLQVHDRMAEQRAR